MNAFEILLFFHILGAFMLAAGATLGEVTLAGVRRTRNTASILALLNASRSVPLLAGGGALLTIVTGSMLVAEAGYSFGAPWISAAYLGWFLAVGLSAAVLGPAERKLHSLAVAENAAGRSESPALIAAVDDAKVRIVTHFLSFIVLVFLFLMVFKPGN